MCNRTLFKGNKLHPIGAHWTQTIRYEHVNKFSLFTSNE